MPDKGTMEMRKTRSQTAEMTPTAFRTLSLAKRNGKIMQIRRSRVMIVRVNTDSSIRVGREREKERIVISD